ncbi:hypothetical protein T265_02649 [Opisthorchis viverrini]|uniref:Uncharacterized protein n=1 Tax=Opisthorchis viverrini TaxID=6198 RepID=A0A074ZUE5_OPIVI|nr:hypothetical protein T265_02649 [Opisthorchis viverrini]KER31088.1 hypothetical protein T265_02649 [Opisthorchis viverrini]
MVWGHHCAEEECLIGVNSDLSEIAFSSVDMRFTPFESLSPLHFTEHECVFEGTGISPSGLLIAAIESSEPVSDS